MDLEYGEAAESFRQRFRVWLADNLDHSWRDKVELTTDPDDPASGPVDAEYVREFDQMLFEAGFKGLTWPKEYGGQGLTRIEQVVFSEEQFRSGAPPALNFFGDFLIGPTLLAWGSEDQKKRFLPPILKSEELWCQGFSEPNAGSDLASLQTRAERDGDEWVITGQKVWTTLGHTADWIFLLARTDPDQPQHKGISYLLVPMKQSGVQVRPIRQLTGTNEFNEIFLDGARTQVENVVGGVGNGWKVAMTTLAFERSATATTQALRYHQELDRIIDEARNVAGADGQPKSQDPVVRQQLAQAYSQVMIMKAQGFRTLTSILEDRDLGVTPSLNKIFWSEYHRWVTELAMSIRGPQGCVVGDDYKLSVEQQTYLFAKSETIWGGTAEIQRNIVGERGLGLPKEPRADRSPVGGRESARA